MQVPRAETMADKVGTPLLEQLPQRMAAAGAVLALVLLLPPLAVLGVASGQKEIRSVLRQHTARAEVVVVLPQQA